MLKQPNMMVDQLKELFDISSNDASNKAARTEAFESFVKKGIPNRKQEEYKYTDLQRVFKKFNLSPGASSAKEEVTVGLPGITANTLLFVNGIFNAEKSVILDEGLEIHALSSDHAAINEHLGKYATSDLDPMLALNTAMATDGLLITLKPNRKLAHDVVIQHHSDGGATALSFFRHLVVAAEGSEATFIEFQTSSGENYLKNSVTEVVIPPNAHIQWVKVQDDSEASHIIDSHFIHQSSNSTSTLTTVSLNGAVIRNNVHISVDGSNSTANLYGLYLLDGSSHVDNHTAVDHTQPHSESNELYKGILDDKSNGVFNGKVFVRQAAQKTNAFQSNKNIIISDNATVNTKPQLEIWADDVKCSHGCTTGQLDQEALFYLRSRGLSKEAARSLLLYAFAMEAVDHLKETPIGDVLKNLVAKKLAHVSV